MSTARKSKFRLILVSNIKVFMINWIFKFGVERKSFTYFVKPTDEVF